MKFSARKFLLIDGLCAAFTVPTQVYAVAYFGNEILSAFKTFKIAILSGLLLFIIYYFMKKLFWNKNETASVEPLVLGTVTPITFHKSPSADNTTPTSDNTHEDNLPKAG